MALNMWDILGDECPEAVVVRGCSPDWDGIVLDWNDETRDLLSSGGYITATMWTDSRVLVRRHGIWVEVPRNPVYV